MAAGVFVLGALVASGTPAHAAEKVEDNRVSFEFVMPGVDNPCTPQFDDITLTANGHASTKTWLYDDGSRTQTRLHIRWAGHAADGTGYVGRDSFDAQTQVEDGWVYITADTRNRLTSQGSDPNFELRLKVRVTFDLAGTSSTTEVVKDYAECRG
jgi:hypothetical protein